MAEKKYFWLKLKDNYFDNPKLKKLRKIAGGDTYTIIYLKMQLESIKNGGIIQFEHIEQTIEEELALKLDENVDDVSMTLAYLKAQSLLEESKDSYLFLEASKNIGSESESAERVRKFREKQKALQCNEDVTNVYISSSISSYNNKLDVENQNIEKKKFVPPSKDEMLEYAKTRNRVDLVDKFYDYFTTGNWVDSKGNKVRNWKQKFITWEKFQSSTNTKLSHNFESRNYTEEEMNDLFDNLDEVEI